MSRFRILIIVVIVACLGGAAALWDNPFSQEKPKQANTTPPAVVAPAPEAATPQVPPQTPPAAPAAPVPPTEPAAPVPPAATPVPTKPPVTVAPKKPSIKQPKAPTNNPQVVLLSLAGYQSIKIPKSFLGFSLETWTIPKLAGTSKTPAAPMVRLTKALGSNGAINIRVGGDSQDRSWWLADPRRVPAKLLTYRQKPEVIANAMSAARGSEYFTTPQWVDTATGFLKATGSPTIIGLNLAENNASHVAGFAQAVYRKLPRRQLQAFEVGNEPSLYWRFPASWKRINGKLVASKKKRDFNFSNLARGWSQYSSMLRKKIGPNVPLAGTALGCPGMRWCNKSSYFYNRFRSNMRVATVHVYAIRQPADPNDRTDISNPLHPSISKLLAPINTTSISSRVKDQISSAHKSGLPIRLDEFNTTPFGGAPGVSNSFAASLWAPEAMFSMRKAGLDGVNFHFGYGTSYRPFWIEWTKGKPAAKVAPIYYGIYFFSRAIQNQARLIPMQAQNKKPGLSTWLLKDKDGNYRLAVINKGQATRTVSISLPGQGAAHLSRLTAASLDAEDGIHWAGQSFGSDGRLHGIQRSLRVQPKAGSYDIKAPANSATLLVVPARS